MKLILPLIFCSAALAAAAPLTLKLSHSQKGVSSYSAPLQEAFTKAIQADPELKEEFARFERAPIPEEAGRYSGEAGITTIVPGEERFREFRATEGEEENHIKIALYYRFDQGFHRGSETRSGFFALFTLTETVTYRPLKDEEYEIAKSTVTARFEGFSNTLTAPAPETADR